MIPVRFHDAARAELAHEVSYYGEVSPRLAERFLSAVERAVRLAAEFPDMGSPYKYRTRRVFPGKFPFSVVYVSRKHEIYVPRVGILREEARLLAVP